MSSFSLINNYQHSIRIPIDGVYTYSFETQNLFRKYQPNGACDMSMLMSTDSKNEIIQNNNRQQNRLELTLAPKITTNGDYHYNFMLFSMNYNILKIGGDSSAVPKGFLIAKGSSFNGVPVFLAKSNLADGRTDDGRTDGRRTELISAHLSETDRHRVHQTETDRVGSKRSETDQIGANLSNFQFLPLLRRISEHVF